VQLVKTINIEVLQTTGTHCKGIIIGNIVGCARGLSRPEVMVLFIEHSKYSIIIHTSDISTVHTYGTALRTISVIAKYQLRYALNVASIQKHLLHKKSN